MTFIPEISPDQPVLIAGPTASGKSALALRIAHDHGGVIVNADAIQVYENWRILTARPSREDEAQCLHALYGHVAAQAQYSAGQWLRDIALILQHSRSGGPRPIIVGGTGLYFTALTVGLAEIPQTPASVRADCEARIDQYGFEKLLLEIDSKTRARIDIQNPMRVQRAWEVQATTGRGLADWQDDTPPPLLDPATCAKFVFETDPAWLNTRIEQRFDQMLDQGALEEARENLSTWTPTDLSAKAIGAAQLIAHLKGEMPLDQAREAATIATRQFAKRQRTWFRSKMRSWHAVQRPEI